jgi:hypothetical protein
MKLTTDRHITAEDLLSGRLDRFGVQIFRIPGQTDFFIKTIENIVMVSTDETGICGLSVPDGAPIPAHFIDMMLHEFDCVVERDVGRTLHAVTDLHMQDSIVDFLGEHHLTNGDNIIRYVRGKSYLIRSEKDLEKAEIAKTLVSGNPGLLSDADIPTLLILTDAVYLQRNPPFNVPLFTKDPAGIKAYIDLLRNWAGANVDEPEAEKVV